MERVIKISDDEYKMLVNPYQYNEALCDKLKTLIRNGTPLPKGHGDLIDKDALGEKLHRYTEAPYQYALTVFNESPTIIEADKGSETEEHSCSKCRYLGWENVGEGMNPVCEQELYIEDTSDKDSSLHKSKPTVSDKNDCYWFDEKEK